MAHDGSVPDIVPRTGGDPGLDAVTGRVTAELLSRSHLMPPGAIAGLLAETARPLGVSGAEVYFADLQQRHLVRLGRPDGQAPEVLGIDSTLAGRAYRTVTLQHVPAGDAGNRPGSGSRWSTARSGWAC